MFSVRVTSTSAACRQVTSILDNDLEAKAMLTLLNRGPVSEGLRESDSTADTPDITHLR